MKIPMSAAILLLLTSFAVQADDSLEGAYERVSLTNTRTGESPEAANRRDLPTPTWALPPSEQSSICFAEAASLAGPRPEPRFSLAS